MELQKGIRRGGEQKHWLTTEKMLNVLTKKAARKMPAFKGGRS